MTSLPAELIEDIIDQTDSKETLLACSLTSKSFLDPSRRNLFKKITLAWNPSLRHAPAFDRALSFLQQYPHLGLYVRDLTLDIPKPHSAQMTLCTVLGAFERLERLAINAHAQEWDELLPPLISAITATISLPLLRTLHILRLSSVPASLMRHMASSVRVLSLNRVVMSAQRDIAEGIAETPTVEHLIIPICLTSELLVRACPFLLNSRKLRQLEVDVNLWRHHYHLCISASQHLKHLELDSGVISTPIDLPTMPALQSLTLAFTRSIDQAGAWTLPPNLTPTLAALRDLAPSLRLLTLRVLISTIQARTAEQMYPAWATPQALQPFELCTLPAEARIHVHCILGYTDPFVVCSAGANTNFEHVRIGFVEFMRRTLPGPHADELLTFGLAEARSRMNYMDHLP